MSLQVIDGGDEAAGFKEGADLRAEIIATGEVGLEDTGGFGWKDDVADGDDVAEPAKFEL